MSVRATCIIAALLLPCPAFSDEKMPAVAECQGAEADASSVALAFEGTLSDLLRQVIQLKHLDVVNAELVGDTIQRFELSCVSIGILMQLMADGSDLQVTRRGPAGFRFDKVANLPAIAALREEADMARGSDPLKLIEALQGIVALAQPGGPGEVQASVESEYHELGNLAMKDKDYVAAERWYRARLVDLDRSDAIRDTNYGIAVSNIADALQYQDKLADAKLMYERALVILEAQADPSAPPNSVIILETLSNTALSVKAFEEAERYADRAWKLLNDPGRSQWESANGALSFAADAESELGRLGPPEHAVLHYTRALKVFEMRDTAEQSDLFKSRQQWMVSAARAGRFDVATVIAEAQLAVAEQHGGTTSASHAVAVYELLALYAEQRKLDRVIALWPRLIEARRATLGENSPHVQDAMRQLAQLYRINGQWDLAIAPEKRAAAIRTVVDRKALDTIDPISEFAMRYDPALGIYCARFSWTTTSTGLALIPPVPDPFPPGVYFEPTTAALPLPADDSDQARYLEQTAECHSRSPQFAGAAMEHAMRLRISTTGSGSKETLRDAKRAIAFYRQAGRIEDAQRIEALVNAH